MLKAVLFDINGTINEIWTNETDDAVYRTVANYLSYQGVLIPADVLKRDFFDINRHQRETSEELYPEFDAVGIFEKIVDRYATSYTHHLPKHKRELLAQTAAEVFRAATRSHLSLYPDVEKTLTALQKKYRLGALSDGQEVWAIPELNAVGLSDFFEHVLVSSHYGYRKPDPRLFKKLLKKMHLDPNEAVYVGNDMYRDVYGAQGVGLKTVFFRSNQGEQTFPDAKPDYVISRFSKLIDAMEWFEKKEKKHRHETP